MATQAEIIAAIQQGNQRVTATFGPLSEEQLNTKIHPGEHGWTAKQILAHLAGRERTHDMLLQLASNADSSAGLSEIGDIDDWNQARVDERLDASGSELLAEFLSTHEALIQKVQNLDAADLEQTVNLPNGELPLSDVLAGSGGMHSVQHAAEVEEALDLH